MNGWLLEEQEGNSHSAALSINCSGGPNALSLIILIFTNYVCVSLETRVQWQRLNIDLCMSFHKQQNICMVRYFLGSKSC